MNQNKTLKLDDSVIANIAKAVQIAILTGTDIVDNLRMMNLEIDKTGEKLVLNSEYESQFKNNINKMLNDIDDTKTSE